MQKKDLFLSLSSSSSLYSPNCEIQQAQIFLYFCLHTSPSPTASRMCPRIDMQMRRKTAISILCRAEIAISILCAGRLQIRTKNRRLSAGRSRAVEIFMSHLTRLFSRRTCLCVPSFRFFPRRADPSSLAEFVRRFAKFRRKPRQNTRQNVHASAVPFSLFPFFFF